MAGPSDRDILPEYYDAKFWGFWAQGREIQEWVR